MHVSQFPNCLERPNNFSKKTVHRSECCNKTSHLILELLDPSESLLLEGGCFVQLVVDLLDKLFPLTALLVMDTFVVYLLAFKQAQFLLFSRQLAVTTYDQYVNCVNL